MNQNEVVDGDPIGPIVNRILMHALREGAEVLRLEPTEAAAEVFHRIAGEERLASKMPPHVLRHVATRFKQMADIPPDEPGVGRGHISLKAGEKIYSVHVSTEAGELGERVEMLIERAQEPAAD